MATSATSPLTQVPWIFAGSYTEDLNRDLKWYSTWARHHYNQGGTGVILAAMEIVSMAVLLCPVINVITYVALSQIFKGKADVFYKEAMEGDNATGAYIMIERGADATQKDSKGRTLLDLFALKGEAYEGFSTQDLDICEALFNKGITADFSRKEFQRMLDTAMAEKRQELTLFLLEAGINPTAAWSTYIPKPKVEHLSLPDWSTVTLVDDTDEDLNLSATKEPLQKFSMKGYPLPQMIRIFGQSMRNCPIILGNNEVERKSLMTTLTREILQGNVPPVLRKKQVIGIDLGTLNTMTKMSDVKALLARYSTQLKGNPNVIFYVSNFEIFEAATNAHPTIRKTIAEWAEIGRVVFSMTPAIYDRRFSNELAVQKGFTTLEVSKPDEREALPLLHQMKGELEAQHQVNIPNSAIQAAISMAHYLKQSSLPQTPYEILDAAAALLKEQDTRGSVTLQEAGRKKRDLQSELQVCRYQNGNVSKKRIEQLEEQLEGQDKLIKQLEAQDAKELALKKQYLGLKSKQAYLRSLDESFEARVKHLSDGIDRELEVLDKQKSTSNIKFEVDRDLVAAVVSARSGIPLDRIGGADREKMLKLEETLGKEVIGQESAVRAISKTLKKARARLRNESQPRGVFLCAGTSGTGKTEMAKAIARNIFGDERNMTRLDMSEYGEKSNKSRLIGAAPGYVGYQEGGQLTEALKRNPYQVILLDEVEKAAPEVLNTFLQVFSDGRLTDGQGNTVDCSQAVFVMTTNLGSREISASHVTLSLYNPFNWKTRFLQWKNGQPTTAQIIDRVLSNSKHFSDEMIGRVEVVTFDPLTNPDDLQAITKKILNQQKKQAEEVHGIDLSWSDRIVEAFSRNGASIRFGARPLAKKVSSVVQDTLADLLLEGKIQGGGSLTFDYDIESQNFTYHVSA